MNHQIPTPFFDRNTQGAPDYSETTASERYFIAPTTPAIVHRQFSDIHNILSNLDQQNELNTKMAIPTEQGLEFVVIKEIIRCEACQKYTKVFTTSHKPILSSFNIGKFIKFFSRLKNFFVSHKSHLVNLNHIEHYSREGIIRMIDKSIVPVSVRNRTDFISAINII